MLRCWGVGGGFFVGGEISGGKPTPWRWFGVGGGGYVLGGEIFRCQKIGSFEDFQKAKKAPKLFGKHVVKRSLGERLVCFFVWQIFFGGTISCSS